MIVLGISGSSHDPAACVLVDGHLVSAIEEERLTGEKHARHSLPIAAAKAALKEAGVKKSSIDRIAFFFDPSLFNHEMWGFTFRNWRRYYMHPIAYRTPRFLMRGYRYAEEARHISTAIGATAPIEYVKHHTAHAASCFYGSGFHSAMVMCLDNIGECACSLLAHADEHGIQTVCEHYPPHSLGMLYATVTEYLGFSPWDEEGKVMALAAYGEPLFDASDVISFHDGNIQISEPFQMIETVDHSRCYSQGLIGLFGHSRRRGEPLTQHHADVAATLQHAIEETVVHMARWLHQRTGEHRICLAGGLALNCKANGRLLNEPFIHEMYVFPAAGDSGTAVGAAMLVSKQEGFYPDTVRSASLGPLYTQDRIETDLREAGVRFRRVEDPAVAAFNILLRDGLVCWFQGRSEFGPRALGNRSILARPDLAGIADTINLTHKCREPWRPLCPSILEYAAGEYFEKCKHSAFMNIAHYGLNGIQEKLPEVFHVDGTARIQAVSEVVNPPFASLLHLVGREIGIPCLLNTSFNMKRRPIVESPRDAINALQQLKIRGLVIGNCVVDGSSK